MKRREFIRLIGGTAATWPITARGQQSDRMRRIAILSSGSATIGALMTFRQTLDHLGWHEGRNVLLEIREGESDINRARGYAADLIAMAPDVFLASNTQMVQLIQGKTDRVPIVFVQVPDPVGSRLVASFARPGGNVTGFTNFDSTMGEKWLQLLKDVVPSLKRVAVILQAENPTAAGYLQKIETAAAKFGVQVIPSSLRDAPGIEAAVTTFARESNGGLIVPPSALATVYSDQIIAATAQARLPAIYPYSENANAGGLMSYGIDRTILFQQAASYVDRILRGEKPSDLPVQTPTKFEMVVNLKTAKALGLTIPESFLLIANEVIE
jgi:putative ABC transport system substrate-binding protein